MTEQPKQPSEKKPQSKSDFIKREVTAMSRILLALHSLPPQRRTAVMAYVSDLFRAESLDRAENTPERPTMGTI